MAAKLNENYQWNFDRKPSNCRKIDGNFEVASKWQRCRTAEKMIFTRKPVFFYFSEMRRDWLRSCKLSAAAPTTLRSKFSIPPNLWHAAKPRPLLPTPRPLLVVLAAAPPKVSQQLQFLVMWSVIKRSRSNIRISVIVVLGNRLVRNWKPLIGPCHRCQSAPLHSSVKTSTWCLL